MFFSKCELMLYRSRNPNKINHVRLISSNISELVVEQRSSCRCGNFGGGIRPNFISADYTTITINELNWSQFSYTEM